MPVEHLDVDDLLELHPDPEPAVRDQGGLETAAAKPFSGFGDYELFPTVFTKAGALLEGIAHLHPFVDGNKRTAWTAAAVLLHLNGWLVEADEDDAYDLVIGVAEGRHDAAAVASWLEAHATAR